RHHGESEDGHPRSPPSAAYVLTSPTAVSIVTMEPRSGAGRTATEQSEQAGTVPGLHLRLGQLLQLPVGDVALPPGHRLGRADLHALPLLDGAHEVPGVQK